MNIESLYAVEDATMVGIRVCETPEGLMASRGVLEGAFSVLEELGRMEEASLTQLAAATGLPKSTTHRLLEQLGALGAVSRVADRRYRMGPRAFRWGHAWRPAPVLRAAAAQPGRHLAAFTGGTVSLAVMDAADTMIIAGIGGQVEEASCLRAGALLPTGNAAEVVITAPRAEGPTPEGYSRAEWNRRLARARDHGVAFNCHQFAEALVGCIAAPVHAPTGAVVAALGVAVLNEKSLPSMIDLVRDAAARISANLARTPASGRALSGLVDPSLRG